MKNLSSVFILSSVLLSGIVTKVYCSDIQTFYEEQKSLQQKLLEEQDKGLEILSNRLDNVKNIAQDMGDELNKQNKDLQNLEDNVNTIKFDIKRQTKKIEKLNNDPGLISRFFEAFCCFFS